jgi:hypothetical protein
MLPRGANPLRKPSPAPAGPDFVLVRSKPPEILIRRGKLKTLVLVTMAPGHLLVDE